MTDRRELIRNGACWAVALSLAMALSTRESEAQSKTQSETQPTPRREPPHRDPVWQRGLGSGSAIWLWSSAPLLVGPIRPPLPLVVMARRLRVGTAFSDRTLGPAS